jgi:hypothetical protein
MTNIVAFQATCATVPPAIDASALAIFAVDKAWRMIAHRPVRAAPPAIGRAYRSGARSTALSFGSRVFGSGPFGVLRQPLITVFHLPGADMADEQYIAEWTAMLASRIRSLR